MGSSQRDMTQFPIDLGDGLILRRSNPQDASALSDFNARIQSDEGCDKPDMHIWAWAHDLLTKPHPTFHPDDFTIIEEAATGKIVSSMNLISQTWAYAGIPFKVGRPELVGTLPEYRNRGLVRLQFDVIHRWSAERSEKVQVITGIPYYYRQFGYEMALNLGGGRVGFPKNIPLLKEGESEPYVMRPAVEADIPFISQLYKLECERSLVSCIWDDALWRYELTGMSEDHVHRMAVCLVESVDGNTVGFITHPRFSWGDTMVINGYQILPQVSWLEVTPSVIRYARDVYELYAPEHGEKMPFGGFGFWLGEDHPVYQVIPDSLPRVRKPYAWYMRVADIPDFLRLISPVLEERLAGSPMAGYSGEVKISFYRDGVRLVLEKGRLATIEAWRPTPLGHSGEAGFPPHTFLQLLFGYRSLDMLKSSFVDCWTDRDDIHVLLNSLFPRQPSDLWPIA